MLAHAIEHLSCVRQIAPNDEVLDAACNLWPEDEQLLLAIAVFGGEDRSGGQRGATLGLAFVNARSTRAMSCHRETMGEDTTFEIGPEIVSLDVACYLLVPGLRGFEVGTSMAAEPVCRSAGSTQTGACMGPKGLPSGKSLTLIYSCIPGTTWQTWSAAAASP